MLSYSNMSLDKFSIMYLIATRRERMRLMDNFHEYQILSESGKDINVVLIENVLEKKNKINFFLLCLSCKSDYHRLHDRRILLDLYRNYTRQ